MTEFTIITTTHAIPVEGERWARSGETVYVYPGDGSDDADPVAEVDGDEFVAIVRGNVDPETLDVPIRDAADSIAAQLRRPRTRGTDR